MGQRLARFVWHIGMGTYLNQNNWFCCKTGKISCKFCRSNQYRFTKIGHLFGGHWDIFPFSSLLVFVDFHRFTFHPTSEFVQEITSASRNPSLSTGELGEATQVIPYLLLQTQSPDSAACDESKTECCTLQL